MSNPNPLQFHRGPYPSARPLVEGEPCAAGIVIDEAGDTFEMIWLGGHDAVDHLVGGGFQLTTGMPEFAAPVGAALYDPGTCTIWVSNSFTSGATSGMGSGTGTGFSGGWCPISENGAGTYEFDSGYPILVSVVGNDVTYSLATSGVTPGTYTYATVTLNEYGQATFAENGTPPTSGVSLVSAQFGSVAYPSGGGTIFSYSLPAGTGYLGLRVKAGGSFAATSSGKDVSLVVGGQTVASIGSHEVQGDTVTYYWEIEAEIVFSSSASLYAVGRLHVSNEDGGVTGDTGEVYTNISTAVNLTIANITTNSTLVKLTGSSSSGLTGDIITNIFKVWLEA